MTSPNYNGYAESDDRIALRSENRKAEEIAFKVFEASRLTDEEKEALLEAWDTIMNDPAHIAVADEFSLADLVTAELTQSHKVLSPAPCGTWQAEAEAQARDDADWQATRESDYPR